MRIECETAAHMKHLRWGSPLFGNRRSRCRGTIWQTLWWRGDPIACPWSPSLQQRDWIWDSWPPPTVKLLVFTSWYSSDTCPQNEGRQCRWCWCTHQKVEQSTTVSCLDFLFLELSLLAPRSWSAVSSLRIRAYCKSKSLNTLCVQSCRLLDC